jgi:pSer/pThr/pTyr-binding forkhead associated (FHA) protein
MLGELVPCGGGDSIPLLQPRLVIGRRSSCDIVLSFPNISSQHCELELLNGFWQLRDLNSRNGVKVNGERIDSKFLHPGDVISIAKNDFEIQYEPTGDLSTITEEDPFSMSLLEKAGLQKREEERRRLRLPPAAQKGSLPRNFDADEDAAMDWLMGD